VGVELLEKKRKECEWCKEEILSPRCESCGTSTLTVIQKQRICSEHKDPYKDKTGKKRWTEFQVRMQHVGIDLKNKRKRSKRGKKT